MLPTFKRFILMASSKHQSDCLFRVAVNDLTFYTADVRCP